MKLLDLDAPFGFPFLESLREIGYMQPRTGIREKVLHVRKLWLKLFLVLPAKLAGIPQEQ